MSYRPDDVALYIESRFNAESIFVGALVHFASESRCCARSKLFLNKFSFRGIAELLLEPT